MQYALISWRCWFKPETISYGFRRNNFLKQSIAAGLIIVECFHPNNFVEIMTLVVEL